MARSHKHRIPAAFGGIMDTKTGRKRYVWGSIWDWATDNATELLKMAGSGIKGYLDYKDAKKRGELEEAAYDDYMKAAEEAGQEARAAVDLNLTPMTVTNIPTAKADITDYTAATGLKHGGISSLRKKYAEGMDEFEVEEMDEEIITPEYLMKEEGVEIGPMAGGNYTEEELEAYEQYKYDMNEQKPGFPIMEIDDFLRFWYSTIKGKENIKMASSPDDFMTEDEMQIPREEIMAMIGAQQAAQGGIIGLRKGGRARYQDGVGPVEAIDISINDNLLGGPDYQGGTTTSDVINQKETNSNNVQEMASSFLTDGMMDTNEALQTAIMINKASEQVDFDKNLVLSLIRNGADLDEALQQAIMIAKGANDSQMKTGGRVKRNVGGIMDLGGLEKDYRFSGGFVPIGEYEKKDDVPARLSKNEFVFTADAVRAAGGGSINKGAKRMYNTMKNLEARPTAKSMTA